MKLKSKSWSQIEVITKQFEESLFCDLESLLALK
jgi:hypothetical protein